jgi:CRP/FNR family transcriptional regulator, cyclic AMP receptor protein
MDEIFSAEEIRSLYSILRKIDFLSSVTIDEIDDLIARFKKYSFKKGKKMIRQGQPGEGLFVVGSGSCSVHKKKGFFGRHELAVIKAGSFFGEMSLVYDNPASATVEALEPWEIYFYSKKDFGTLVSKNASLKAHLQKLADKRTSENVLGK